MSKSSITTSSYHQLDNYQVSTLLYQFINQQVLPESGVEQESFWAGLEGYLNEFIPTNRALLAKRKQLQSQINDWHQANPQAIEPQAYQQFLRDINYIVDEPQHVSLDTAKVDRELALLAGPQLVVPVMNARYALNAANARWGSLYDALYGTNALEQSGDMAQVLAITLCVVPLLLLTVEHC